MALRSASLGPTLEERGSETVTTVMIGLAKKTLKHPWIVLGLMALLLGPAVYLCKNLKLDNDPRKLAPTNAERDAANEAHEKYFGADDTVLLLMLEGDDPKALVTTVEALEEAIMGMDNVASIRTPASVKVPMDLGDGITFTPAFGRWSEFKGSTIGRIAALQKWTGGTSLVSSDGRHMVLIIRLDPELKNPILALKYMNALQGVITEHVPSTITARTGGLVATRVGSVQAIISDGMLLFPLAGLIVFLVCVSRFGSIRYTVALMTCLLWSITMTAGFASVMDYPLTPLTQIFPVLLMIIGIADGVHLIERFAEDTGERIEAWQATLQDTGSACILTTVTTAIGFLALFVTRIPVLHEFALIVSVGVVFSLLANLFLLPALCLVFCKTGPKVPVNRGQIYGRFVLGAHQKGRPLICAGVVLLVMGLIACKQIHVDFFLSKVLADDAPVSEGNQILRDKFGGSIPIELTVTTTQGDFNDPEPLAGLETLGDYLIGKNGTIASHAVALKKMRLALTGDELLPTDRNTAAQLELAMASAKLTPLLAEDRTVARLSAISPDVGGHALLAMQKDLNELAQTLPNVNVKMVGSMIAAAEGFGTLVTELITGLFIALALIIVIIGLSLRSFKMALISILPNSLPVILGIAFFPVTGRYLDVFSAVFFTVALGIAVDDTIHMLKRFQVEHQRLGDPIQALERAGKSVGTAVADTSMVLISGFALLMLSGFPANQLSGALAAGLIGAALLCDLIFVPAGIALFRWDKTSSTLRSNNA